MIIAKFVIDEDRKMLTFKTKGHANYSIKANDIVCASASMLMYTLAQNVKYEEAGGSLRHKPDVRIRKGNAAIVVSAKDDDSFIRLSHLYCVIQTGYQMLARQYPDFVSVTMFGEEDHSGI